MDKDKVGKLSLWYAAIAVASLLGGNLPDAAAAVVLCCVLVVLAVVSVHALRSGLPGEPAPEASPFAGTNFGQRHRNYVPKASTTPLRRRVVSGE